MVRNTLGALQLLVLAIVPIACSTDITQPTLDAAPPAVSPAVVAGTADISDGQGTAWRQITETANVTWSQAAALCPRDGITPCSGTIGTQSLAGWVWATDAQVVQMIARYEPTILTSRMLVGTEYANGVNAFFAAFHPTEVGGCSGTGYIISCSFGAHVSAWSSTSLTSGTGVATTVQSGFFSLPFIQVTSDATINSPSASRGLFMWRADGSGGTGIVAHDDSGHVEAPHAGTAVPNVLVNDSLAGAPTDVSQVALLQLATTNAGVSLDTTSGAVHVDGGIRVGTESLRYRVCERARPSNCATAMVYVSVDGNRVDAVDDAGATKTGGGVAVASVLTNDTFADRPATLGDVTLTTESSDAALSLRADGAVVVAAGSAPGAYTLRYRICETVSPTNCDADIVTVTVTAFVIDAVNDQGSAMSAPGGTAVANVLANDQFDVATASLALVQLSLVSSGTAGVTLDLTDGSVDVAPSTAAGSSTLTYRICERARPANCDQATVGVTIVPQAYVVTNDRASVKEGSSGSFSVKLLQPPTGTVTTTVSYLAGTMALNTTVTTLTFTPANWNTAQSIPFTTVRDSDKDDNAATLQLSAVGIAPRLLVVRGIDGDRKGTFPVPTLLSPVNGETVSGVVSFSGTVTDSDGTVIDGKFSVDDVRHATVAPVGGSVRAPGWNSATVPNGWHVLEFRATDNLGNDGRMRIKFLVAN